MTPKVFSNDKNCQKQKKQNKNTETKLSPLNLLQITLYSAVVVLLLGVPQFSQQNNFASLISIHSFQSFYSGFSRLSSGFNIDPPNSTSRISYISNLQMLLYCHQLVSFKSFHYLIQIPQRCIQISLIFSYALCHIIIYNSIIIILSNNPFFSKSCSFKKPYTICYAQVSPTVLRYIS